MQPITYHLTPDSPAAGRQEIEVPQHKPAKIGRLPDNDYSFPHDSQMSSVHFEIWDEGGGCRIRDLGSLNGLFLNSKRVATGLAVEGDEIRAGEAVWRVAIRGGHPPPASANAALHSQAGGPPRPTPAAEAPSGGSLRIPAPQSVSAGGPAPAADGQALRLELQASTGQRRQLQASERLTIGRRDLAEWVFADDQQMSSCHLEIYCQDGRWRAKDLGSSNGTYVNEIPATEIELLQGDEIRCGQTRFQVVSLLGAVAPAQPVVGSPLHSPTPAASMPVAAPPPAAPLATSPPTPPPPTSLPPVPRSPSTPPLAAQPGGSAAAAYAGSPTAGSHFPAAGMTPPAGYPPAAGPTPPAGYPPVAGGTPAAGYPRAAGGTPAAGYPRGVPRPLRSARLRRLSDGREFELQPSESLVIGRSPQAPIALPEDAEVSTRHASVLFDGNYVRLRDVGSTNGTFVRGGRVQAFDLEDGDRFRVGQTELQVSLPPPTAVGQEGDGVYVPQFVASTPVAPMPPSAAPLAHAPPPGVPPLDARGTALGDASAAAPEEFARPSAVPPPATGSPAQEPPAGIPPAGIPPAGDWPAWSEEQPPAAQGPKSVDDIPYFTADDFSDFSSESPTTSPPPAPPPATSRPLEEPPAAAVDRGPPATDFDVWSLDDFAPQEDPLPTSAQPLGPAVDAESAEAMPGSTSPSGPSQQQADRSASPPSDVPRSSDASLEAEQPLRTATELNVAGEGGTAIGFQKFPCGSGLVLYRGVSSTLDPLEVALRLLQATQGWVLHGAEIEKWIAALDQQAAAPASDWLCPARADDVSWMVPFSQSWGSDKTWLVFARAELADVQKSLLNLRHPVGDRKPLISALTPTALSEFLANQSGTLVQRFFSPLDAIFLEIHGGQRWALFGRKDLESSLKQLDFVHRPQW